MFMFMPNAAAAAMAGLLPSMSFEGLLPPPVASGEPPLLPMPALKTLWKFCHSAGLLAAKFGWLPIWCCGVLMGEPKTLRGLLVVVLLLLLLPLLAEEEGGPLPAFLLLLLLEGGGEASVPSNEVAMGVMRTSWSTSPSAERAPGWNPPALGFRVEAVVVEFDALLPVEEDAAEEGRGLEDAGAPLLARMEGDARAAGLLSPPLLLPPPTPLLVRLL